MVLKCSRCGSLNAEDMASCGNCGTSLTQADRFVEEKQPEPSYELGKPCPYCGEPMEEGVLEMVRHVAYPLRWVSQSEEITPIGSVLSGLCELQGWRCKSCNCMLLDY